MEIQEFQTRKPTHLSGNLTLADPKGSWAIWKLDDESYAVEVTNGPSGRLLQQPVAIKVQAIWTEADLDIAKYVIESLSASQPVLIPLALKQATVFRVARHLRRGGTSSPSCLRSYVDALNRVFKWLNRAPDDVALWLKGQGVSAQKTFKEQLEDYFGLLQARGLAPKTIRFRYTTVKSWLKLNDLPTPYITIPKARVRYHDRAPTCEEQVKILEVADLRGKVIVSMMTLGGFREGTLAKLRYSHVRKDLERGIVPLHIHVEADITKGKYADYDTFLGQEAVDYLKLYMEYRRRGSPSGKIPPEEIDDDSPLIRGSRLKKSASKKLALSSKDVRPLTPKRIYATIFDIYVKAGLISKGRRRHELRAHSLRKYFRTQLTALGVPTEYVEYMMGHVISTYNTVKTKGVEFLRSIYATSGLSIRPKTKLGKMELLKEIIRGLGEDPEKILVKEAFSKPYRTICADAQENALQLLRETLKDLIRRELRVV